MAAQTDGSASVISAEVVGHAFVSQFYRVLHQSPEQVYRFYQDSSTMSRPGADGTLVTVTAMEGIKDLILSLDCEDYKAEILTADAQASHMNGVIVLVTGCLTGKDNVRRKFTESFFLAPQDKGYFVLNDAFRFVEEDSLPMVNSVEEKDVDQSAPAPVMPVQQTSEVPNDSFQNQTPVAEDKVEMAKLPKDEQKSNVTENAALQASADSSHDVQPVAETSSNGHVESNGHVDAPKKSYASILWSIRQGSTTALGHAPTSAAKAATPNRPQQSVASSAMQQTRAAATPPAAPESSAPNGSNVSASNTDQSEDKGYSIYIGDLPYDATAELVEQEFKKFGRIKRNGIQVRSNKGYCFGFVEYEDASSKQNAIEMGTIRIGGKEAFIQEKKTTTRVVNGVSMYPSGRGGYRNDGFRGRGNYSNGGHGYARNDYGKRNGEVPIRGSRNGDGYVYQNGGGGGGRGAFQGQRASSK